MKKAEKVLSIFFFVLGSVLLILGLLLGTLLEAGDLTWHESRTVHHIFVLAAIAFFCCVPLMILSFYAGMYLMYLADKYEIPDLLDDDMKHDTKGAALWFGVILVGGLFLGIGFILSHHFLGTVLMWIGLTILSVPFVGIALGPYLIDSIDRGERDPSIIPAVFIGLLPIGLVLFGIGFTLKHHFLGAVLMSIGGGCVVISAIAVKLFSE